VQTQLIKHKYNFTRIDGKMSASQRDAAISALDNDPSLTVMLASLHVGAVGLNLVSANQVILADSWWAPAIEDQAVDRVHRLGQKRPTTVFRLVMEQSIEDKVLSIQEEKRKLAMLALSEKTGKRSAGKTARLADLEKLLK
jgi:SWI/SNF-related matrix-associated actin-dependent regulator of chromatin subfamily A3